MFSKNKLLVVNTKTGTNTKTRRLVVEVVEVPAEKPIIQVQTLGTLKKKV